MKKLFILLLSVLSLAAVAQNQTIALLEPRAGEGSVALTPMEKAMVRGELRKAIVNMPGYEAITRADIDQMMKEQNFQRTGMVSEAQIKQMGEMSGADYICVSTLTKSNTEFYLEAYLIHLESGRMSNPASQYGELANGKFANLLPVCEAVAQELLGATNLKASRQLKSTTQTKQGTHSGSSQIFAPGESATIIILRPFDFAAAMGAAYGGKKFYTYDHFLDFDSQFFGNVPSMTYYEIAVKPGNHTIIGFVGQQGPDKAKADGQKYSLVISAVANMTYYARIDEKKMTIELIDEKKWQKELKKANPVKWVAKVQFKDGVFYDSNGKPIAGAINEE